MGNQLYIIVAKFKQFVMINLSNPIIAYKSYEYLLLNNIGNISKQADCNIKKGAKKSEILYY